jgi:hypothetical protein
MRWRRIARVSRRLSANPQPVERESSLTASSAHIGRYRSGLACRDRSEAMKPLVRSGGQGRGRTADLPLTRNWALIGARRRTLAREVGEGS